MRADLWIHRKGGALMRVRVRLARRPIRGVAARMRQAGWPAHAIARRLCVPRRAVERVLSGPDAFGALRQALRDWERVA